MSDVESPVTRPDVDILADVESFILRYPPLANDRRHLQVTVKDGVVELRGYVKTPNSYDYLVNQLPRIDSIIAVNTDQLYVDERLRLAVGQVLPPGVLAKVVYGTVILSGRLPPGIELEALADRIGRIPGIRRVIANFPP